MKTKNSKIVKRIKNYLSSLSKWAKKHIKKIIIISISLCLFLVPCCRRPTRDTVRADSIQIFDKVVLLPSASVKTSTVNGYSSPIYIGVDTLQDIHGLYIVSIDNRLPVPEYSYGLFTLERQSSAMIVYNVDNVRLGGYYTGTSQTTGVGLYNSIEGVPQSSLSLYINLLNWDSAEYGDLTDAPITEIFDLLYNAVYYVRVNTTTGSISWSFLDSSAVELASFIYSSDAIVNSSSITASPIMSISWFLTDDVWQRAQELGEAIGYDRGYSVGYNRGLDATFSDISPFTVFKVFVDDLFAIELFGDIALGDIIRIGFACVLLGFIIKIFLGG